MSSLGQTTDADGTMCRFAVPASSTAPGAAATASASSPSSSTLFQLRLGFGIAFVLIALGLYLVLFHSATEKLISSSVNWTTTEDSMLMSGSNIKHLGTEEQGSQTVPESEQAYEYLNDTRYRHQIPLFNSPLVYVLEFKMFLPWKQSISFGENNYTMEGKSRMIFTVTKRNKRVQVHTLKLHIASVRLEDDFGRNVSIEEISRAYPHVLDIRTTNLLAENMNYSLHIEFTGQISRTSTVGIYASSYSVDGQMRELVTTHCQTQHARSVFPCIDNPEAKAHFEVTIIHPIGTTAVSNGMEYNQTHDGEWTSTSFLPSPLMSTYLFALAVSDYSYLENVRNGVRLRVHVPSSNLEDATMAINYLPRILDFYEEYFEMDCPMTKLDVFAVPVSHVSAMENWGLIMVKSQHLLYNSHVSGHIERRAVIEVLAHEIAHQWFGNLVTMKWWNNLWLNEGFATMMGNKAVSKLFGTLSTVKSIALSMRDDQMINAVPISRPDTPPFEPNEQFRTQYTKPSTLMQVTEKLVGEETFRAGVNRLLKQFAYKNVDHIDLMEALTYAHDSSAGNHFAGQPFSLNDFMSTWIYEPGYPMLVVAEREPGIHTVTQIGFRFFTTKGKVDKDKQWKIPIFLRHPVTKEKELKWLLENESLAVDLDDDYVLDYYGSNLFRVLYTPKHYKLILDRLHTQPFLIPEQIRARMVDDSFTFAEHGIISYNIPWNVTAYLTVENLGAVHGPAHMLSAHMDLIITRLRTHPKFDTVIKYMHVVLGYWFQHCNDVVFGERESYNESVACEIVFKRLCIFGYPACMTLADKEIKKLMANCGDKKLSSSCNHIPRIFRLPIYGAASKFGGVENFNFLYEKYRIETYTTEQAKIWDGMISSLREESIHKAWYYVLIKNRNNEPLRYRCQDYAKHYHHRNHFISFMKEHITTLIKRLPLDDIVMLFNLLSRGIFLKEEIQEFREISSIAGKLLPSNMEARVNTFTDRIVEAWKWTKIYGDFIIGNMTEVLKSLEPRLQTVIKV